MKRVLSLLALALAVITAYGYDFETEGLRFTLMDNSELSVAGLGSSQGEYYRNGKLTIPDVVTYGREYKVTKIEENAFIGNKHIVTASIGDEVKLIGRRAFADCTGLIEVTIGKSVNYIKSEAFEKCKLIAKVNITDLAAWCGITFNEVFEYSPELQPYIIPSIEGYSANPLYYGATLLINGEEVDVLNIPPTVKKISDYAFMGCLCISSINFPASVTEIGEYSFGYCTGLKSLVIPNSVTEMGEHAFAYCSGLESIKLGDGLTSTGDYTFSGCIGLKSIEWGSAIEVIGKATFYGCTALSSISWPASLTAISEASFSSSGLSEINISGNIKEIPKKAFSNCAAAMSITIGDGVENMELSAFDNCTGVKSLKIGKSLKEIPGAINQVTDGAAFKDCSALEEIIVDPENEYYYCPNGSNTLVDKATNTLIRGCYNSEISSVVKIIGKRAFQGCEKLKAIEIPSSVTHISMAAFCSTGLISIIIPSSVTCIDIWAFAESALESVDIASSVEKIGQSAFDCEYLTQFIYRRPEPPTDGSLDSDFASYMVYQNATLYVPEGSAELYRAQYPWNRFVNIKEFPAGDGVETVSIDALDPTAPVEVYDLGGRRLGSGLGALPSGIYLVKQGSHLCKVAR